MSITGLDHVGVLVDDFDQGYRFLSETFGLTAEHEGPQPELGVQTAFFRCGPVLIELIARVAEDSPLPPLDGVAARIDHIALEVDDMAATTAALGEAGVGTLDVGAGEAPLVLGANLNHWTDPASSDGVKYQLIEVGGAGG